MSKIKSFRGKLVHGEQDKIHLSGGDADTGYRIHRFDLMQTDPSEQPENAVKIYSVKQTSVDGNVDFDDDTLLAAGMIWSSTNQIYPHDKQIVFDQDVVNQDIYITNFDEQFGAGSVNYYLELEEIKMSKNQQAVVNFEAALLHGQ
tara:strand:+ start:282 stop:719 length:438 start_codon:yes stop_codon:yes gene_type:complete